jgi:hypothetical protein
MSSFFPQILRFGIGQLDEYCQKHVLADIESTDFRRFWRPLPKWDSLTYRGWPQQKIGNFSWIVRRSPISCWSLLQRVFQLVLDFLEDVSEGSIRTLKIGFAAHRSTLGQLKAMLHPCFI